VQTFVKNK